MTVDTLTSGTSWLCPAGVTSVQIECEGAGGGAGGSDAFNLGGGGGGGAYAKKNTFTVVPGNSYTYQIGALGTGGAANSADGSPGTDTWFNSTGTVLAKAGLGGIRATGFVNGAGGAGGAAGSCVGDVKTSGTAGTSGGSGGAGAAPMGGVGGAGGNPPTAGTAPGGGGGASSVTGQAGANGSRGEIKLTYTAVAATSAAFLTLI